jgi:hypothetical protein
MANTAALNRSRVVQGTVGPSTGMKKYDLAGHCKAVFGYRIQQWPCKKNHPHHRISEKNGRHYCLECEQEKARERRENG